MDRQECKKMCRDMYQDFYRAISLNYNYVYKVTDTETKVTETFLNLLEETYGLNQINAMFLLNYIEYQFHYWYDFDDSQFGKGKVVWTWVFGRKPFERKWV